LKSGGVFERDAQRAGENPIVIDAQHPDRVAFKGGHSEKG
jgi:hypothetical protein